MNLASLARALFVAGAALASAGAQALTYADMFSGAFGTLSWASSGLSWADYDGGTLHFLSSADKVRTDANRNIGYQGVAASSLLDGKLHAEATAGMCHRDCAFQWPDTNSVGAGTGIWETVHLQGGQSMFLLPMRLRIDGIQGGAAYGRVRFYAGYGDPFQHWRNKPSNGWHVLGSGPGPVDRVIDFSEVLVFADSALRLYVELETLAFASSSGPSFADFGNTVSFEWDLPQGVSFTSASGQFLTAPVPEAATWAMWLAGVGIVGSLARRDRTRC